MTQQPVRTRRMPQRTCVACRQVAGKRGLIRLVRTDSGVEIDPTGKRAGRGMYLHATRVCWGDALRGGRIEQALRTRLRPEDRQALLDYMETLPSAAEVV